MCAICTAITVRVDGCVFLWKNSGRGCVSLCTKWLHTGQLIKIMCLGWGTKVMAPEACQMWPDIIWHPQIWGPQPRSKGQKWIHMGFILHAPWQMQMGTYETWGIWLTDRAVSTKTWMHQILINQFWVQKIKYYILAKQQQKPTKNTQNV